MVNVQKTTWGNHISNLKTILDKFVVNVKISIVVCPAGYFTGNNNDNETTCMECPQGTLSHLYHIACDGKCLSM